MNFRAGPGKHFATLGTVPAGTEVPVLGWITDRLRDGELWIRTEYEGRRGWLCGHDDGERLIERDGGPLFPMEVTVAKLLFTTNLRGSDYPRGEKWLEEGDELEFASLWGESWLNADADGIDFWVQHDGVWGRLCAYATEEYVRDYYKSFVIGYPGSKPAGWFVDFPPEFLASNLNYNYEEYDFEFVEGAAHAEYYLGPGFEFPRTDRVFLHSSILFVEGPWALVLSWNVWSWVYLGTDASPNVQMTDYIPYKDWEAFPDLKTVDLEDVFRGYKGVSLYYDIWPSSNALYIRFAEPYFSPYIDKITVKHVDVYQPPTSDPPVYSGPPAAGIDSGWHETVILTYPMELPAGFDFEAPFKMDVIMVYDEAEEFTLTYECNNP